MNEESEICDGGCSCGHVRYQMTSRPMIVHCCHCRWCQRESGASFAVNALIEADRVKITRGELTETMVPTESGIGQRFSRCPKCRVTLWSNYLAASGGLSEVMRFVRVGTLDTPDLFPPDVHIFTSTKQPWFILPPDALSFDEYFVIEDIWSQQSLSRRTALQNNL